MKAVLENNYLSDRDVANYARQSFNKLAENFTDTENDNLIKFLARGMRSGDWAELLKSVLTCQSAQQAHELLVYVRSIPEHFAPFAHPHITLRIEAPIPIARQMFKHKIGMIESEESRRYVSYEPVFFVPKYFRPAAESVKQGSANKPMENNDAWLASYTHYCELGKMLYLEAIAAGMCAEQARLFLPQGTEVKWVLTGSLYAFANLYNQRSDNHAQIEIQDLAESIGDIIETLYPISWGALTRGDY